MSSKNPWNLHVEKSVNFYIALFIKNISIKSYKPCTMICTEVVKCWTFSHRMLLRNLEKLWILHTNPFIKLESIPTFCNCIKRIYYFVQCFRISPFVFHSKIKMHMTLERRESTFLVNFSLNLLLKSTSLADYMAFWNETDICGDCQKCGKYKVRFFS